MSRFGLCAMPAGLAALAACVAPASEQELRVGPREYREYSSPAAPSTIADAVYEGAKACFDGKKINFRMTLVHKEPTPKDGFLVTIYQLGVYDPKIFAQIDILPDPAGSRIEMFNSAALAMTDRLGPFVKSWIDGDPLCPRIIF